MCNRVDVSLLKYQFDFDEIWYLGAYNKQDCHSVSSYGSIITPTFIKTWM